ncbi:MAG: hypothetical protein ACRC8A_04270 [Microcoleaceae cyanobacterium]
MKITLEIPDHIASQLADSPEILSRRFLSLRLLAPLTLSFH